MGEREPLAKVAAGSVLPHCCHSVYYPVTYIYATLMSRVNIQTAVSGFAPSLLQVSSQNRINLESISNLLHKMLCCGSLYGANMMLEGNGGAHGNSVGTAHAVCFRSRTRWAGRGPTTGAPSIEFLCIENGLPMARHATAIWPPGDGVAPVAGLERGWDLVAHVARFTRRAG